jgi:hypothetical protein
MPVDPGRNQGRGGERRSRIRATPAVETLEGRALLSQAPLGPVSASAYTYPTPSPMPTPSPGGNPGGRRQAVATGVVTKSPRFYEVYTGPKLAELDAVKASGKLSPGGTFTFTGTNKGAITQAPAVYVWGIDRSGSLSAGPFTNRPNIKFDAEVVVTLDASLTPTARVVDLVGGTTTVLPAGSARVSGKTVTVTVDAGLLPSTGLDPSRYRFNYWPEDGLARSSSDVASFAPERATIPVGRSR